MKKSYLFILGCILSCLFGYALEEGGSAANTATVNLQGKFYTFSVQATQVSETHAAELFSATPAGNEIDTTATVQLYEDEVEVRLIGQAPDNKFYVTINGQPVVSTSESGFEAVVTLKAGDVINVTNEAPSTATINLQGKFYTFSVQATQVSETHAAELFSATPAGNEIDTTATVQLYEDEVEVRLIGQAPENAIYVTINGNPVASTSESGFEAVVTLKAGDVINVTNEAPATATINLQGKFYTFSVQATHVSETHAAELFSATPAGNEIDTTATVQLYEDEVEVRLIGQAPENAIYVTINGKPVTSTSESSFEAVVTLKAGDVINVTNEAPATATINLQGKFYTFSVQATHVSETHAAELFSATPAGNEIDTTATVQLYEDEVEVRLIGQAPENAIYVTINGKPVVSTNDSSFEAVVTLKAGDVINVTNEAPATATINLQGKFYTFSVQATQVSETHAAELFSATPAGNEIDTTATVQLYEDEVEVRLIGQAPENAIYVTINGKPVVSINESSFEAVVTLKAGDVINVTNEAPATATINLQGKFYTFSVQATHVSETHAAELFSATPAGNEIDTTATVQLYEDEVEVRLIGQAPENAIYVTINGKPVVSTNDSSFEAVVTLKAGDVINVTNEAPATATINLQGKFYTFSVQATHVSETHAAELFSATPAGEAVDMSETIQLYEDEVEVRLVGQAPDNAIYVTINGKPVTSTSESGFEAIVTLKAGDVINVTNEAPATATINLQGKFYTFSVQATQVSETHAAELFSATPAGEAVDMSETIQLYEDEVEVRLVGQAPDNAIYVTINGKPVTSTSESGFEAIVTLKAGDVINVANDVATGISSVQASALTDGKIYNIQGMEVKATKPGLYIINGKKVLVK